MILPPQPQLAASQNAADCGHTHRVIEVKFPSLYPGHDDRLTQATVGVERVISPQPGVGWSVNDGAQGREIKSNQINQFNQNAAFHAALVRPGMYARSRLHYAHDKYDNPHRPVVDLVAVSGAPAAHLRGCTYVHLKPL